MLALLVKHRDGIAQSARAGLSIITAKGSQAFHSFPAGGKVSYNAIYIRRALYNRNGGDYTAGRRENRGALKSIIAL